MFGYIIPNKDELKIKEERKYRSYYCGLCHGLGKYHGLLSKLTLSYDLNFVYILLSNIYAYDTYTKRHFCILHPFTKKEIITNSICEYVSDLNLILTYYKIEDDILDEGSLKAKLLKLIYKKEANKLIKKYPDLCNQVKDELEHIHQLENEQCDDIDQLSTHFGKIMGNMFNMNDDIFSDDLYQCGFYIGKFVYLLDAYDDLEKDIKKKQFNPLIKRKDQPSFKKDIEMILELYASQCMYYYHRLPIDDDKGILENILFSGIFTKFNQGEKNDESISSTRD